MTRSPIIVIADDLTGAAEIAGIGLRHELRVQLVPDAIASGWPNGVDGAQLTVFNIDTRSLDDRIDAGALASDAGEHVSTHGLVYKKIDSVLRGHVLPEIEAFLDKSGHRAALVVPQNPSRGRTIDADGTYRIDGVPLDRTAFARDPDHPRTTANARALLGRSDRATIGPATTLDDVRRHAATLRDDVLPVGSADFFQAILERDLGAHAGVERSATPDRTVTDARSGVTRVRITPACGRVLFISGTADQSTRATLVAEMRRRGAPCAELPIAWFVGDRPSAHAVDDWARQFRAADVAALLAPAERAEPSRVHGLLCEAAAALIDAPVSLYVDGGATAMALSRRMGWTAMAVVEEVGPGAVTLAPADGIELTIKPGSYAWPADVWSRVASAS